VAAKGERVKNGELFDWSRNPDAQFALPSFKVIWMCMPHYRHECLLLILVHMISYVTQFLSPELADGATADHDDNADVFSLAKIAYHVIPCCYRCLSVMCYVVYGVCRIV
jgi:hypothetical protein